MIHSSLFNNNTQIFFIENGMKKIFLRDECRLGSIDAFNTHMLKFIKEKKSKIKIWRICLHNNDTF